MKGMNHLIAYINYLFKAKSGFRIHSPFVFELMDKVIHNKKRYPEFNKIENLRKKLKADKTIIKVKDFGTGGITNSEYSSTTGTIAKRSSIPPKDGRLLNKLAHHFQCKKTLELGTSLGLGTAYLAYGNSSNQVVSIEGSPATAQQARKNIASLELKNVDIVTGEFSKKLKPVLNELGEVDLVYFDGNHRKEPTLEYFETCRYYARNDSIFIFDDIHWSKEMEEAWKIICSDNEVTLSIDLFSLGLVFFRREMTKQHYFLRY